MTAGQAHSTETSAHSCTHRVPPTPSRQRLQQPPPHSHPTPRYRVTHPPNLVAPTPETAHLPFHTEAPQYPTSDRQPQTTQPETTTMEAHQSTPNDTDDHMGQENPAVDRGRRFDPHSEPTISKPPNWHEMSTRQKKNWNKRKKNGLG